MKKLAIALAGLLIAGGGVANAGDTLFYTGHGGLNEGHATLAAIVAGEGGSVDLSNAAVLPSLAGYRLVIISTPGWLEPANFFSAAEINALNAFLADAAHKVVCIGEWDGFYGPGQAVLIDLISQIGGGTGIQFIPGVFDGGCFAYNCDGALGVSPLVAGLSQVCRAATAIWNPGSGGSVAFPVESASPWIVDNGTNVPCIVGIGDSNTLSDPCGHLGHADTAEFARRLYTITCAGDPVPTEESTWGVIKNSYR